MSDLEFVLNLLVTVLVVSEPCSAVASFIGNFFSSKLFVNVSPDIVLSKSMHPLAESSAIEHGRTTASSETIPLVWIDPRV
jgi:hypothetical protein